MYNESIYLIGAGLLLAMLISIEVGTYIGHRRSARANDASRSQTSAIQGSILGMLALLLGFTFSIALQRNDTRNTEIVNEANAIGTAWLRVDLLPAPFIDSARAELERYLQARVQAGQLTLIQQDKRSAELEAATSAGTKLWEQAVAAAVFEPSPVRTGLYVQALNDMFDAMSSRDAALNRRVPAPALFLLLFTFVVASGLLGYTSGLDRNRPPVAASVMASLIVLLVVLTLDLDRPRRGLIQIDQKPLLELLETAQARPA